MSGLQGEKTCRMKLIWVPIGLIKNFSALASIKSQALLVASFKPFSINQMVCISDIFGTLHNFIFESLFGFNINRKFSSIY